MRGRPYAGAVTEHPVATAEPAGFDDEQVPAALESRTLVMLVAGFSAVLIATLAALLPVKYAVLHPGPVLNTLGQVKGKPLIAITGRKTYPTTGQLDLTTVSVVGGPDRPITLFQVVEGWLDRTSAVVPEEQVFAPGQSQQQSDAENKAEMVSSQESATAAALTTLGIAIPTTLAVAGVEPSAPASGVLETGDVIRSVNGQAITDLEKLRTILESTKAGGDVEVEVQRKDVTKTVTARTIPSDQDGRTVLGVYLDPTFKFPFSVKIQIEDIGGPSAGTMFALGIIDTLTPGDLTGGKKIAGTGTIDADGLVGPIGGIRQKLVGARRAGARYFLAPAENCTEVRKHIPDGLTVVKITTLDSARDAVMGIAAGRVATLPNC
jgi:PDZ domain-containing protein